MTNVLTEVVKLVNFIRSKQTTHRQQDFLSDMEPEWEYVPTTHKFTGWVVVRKIKRLGELSHTLPKMYVRLHVKYPLFLSHFNFLDRFSKNSRIQNFTKIRQMGAVLFRADGQTQSELTVAFRNFVSAPSNSPQCALSTGYKQKYIEKTGKHNISLFTH